MHTERENSRDNFVGLQSPTSLSMDFYDVKLRTLSLKKAQKYSGISLTKVV